MSTLNRWVAQRTDTDRGMTLAFVTLVGGANVAMALVVGVLAAL